MPCSSIKALKKCVNQKLGECLYVWDSTVKGVMIKYFNLKLQKKMVEIIEEQDDFNIPVIYEAIYFIPKEGINTG